MPKQDVAYRAVLTSEMFTTAKVSVRDKHSKAISPEFIPKLAGRTTVSPLYAGQQVLAPQVGIEEKDGKPVAMRNDNMRRFKIPFQNNVISPKLKKGDMIDLTVSYKPESAVKQSVTLTMLKSIEVDEVEDSGPDGQKGVVCYIHPQDADFVTYAISNGFIQISIVPPGSKQADTFFVTPQTFFQRYNLNLITPPGR